MNLRFVEAFYWVASLKSVTRAAEKLFLTQSAMSSRIAALEEELGVLLLDRRDKQFRLTVAGLRFFTYAQRLLELQREVKAEMGSGAPQAMTLRLGAIESVLHSWLIPMVEKLRADHPGLELALTVETTPVLLDQVRRGALDLIFAALPASMEGLRNRALPPMEMVFVGNAKLQRRRMYRLADLGELDILTFQRGSQPHVALLDTFRQKQLEPKAGAYHLLDFGNDPAGGGRFRRRHAAFGSRPAPGGAPRAQDAQVRCGVAAAAGVRYLPRRPHVGGCGNGGQGGLQFHRAAAARPAPQEIRAPRLSG